MHTDDCNQNPASDDDFRRRLTFAEEDRRRLTTAPWTGGFRWFRAPNVVDLESYRRQRGAIVAKDDRQN
jgi:hypothetical protein